MYRSPFSILPALEAGPLPDRSALLLEKRRLQAEFELQGSGSITVNGHELHRQDVSDLFDALQQPDELAFHRAVSAQPHLRAFLEHAVVHTGAGWLEAPLAAWLHRVSPLFAEAQHVFFKALIDGQAGEDSLKAYIPLPKLLQPQHLDEAYRSALRLLVEKKNQLFLLVNRARAGNAVEEAEIRHWATPPQLALINSLPPEFAQQRYLIADALNNLCVAFDKAKKHKLALRAIEAASKVYVDQGELRTLIPRNLQLIRKRRGNIFHQSYWWVIVIIVVALRIFLSLGKDKSPHADIRWFVDHQQQQQQQEGGIATGSPELQPEQQFHTFHSLVAAINSAELSGGGNRPDDKDNTTGLSFRATRPLAAGDNPFAGAFSGFTDSIGALKTRFSSPLNVCNRSGWDFILLGQGSDGNWAGAWYVPAGTCLTVFLPKRKDAFHLAGCAGRGWKENRIQFFDLYNAAGNSAAAILLGGFEELPGNAAGLISGGELNVMLNRTRASIDSLYIGPDLQDGNRIRLVGIPRLPRRSR